MALMLFRERRIARSCAAAELEYRDGLALQKGRCLHAVDLAMRTRRRNGKERVEQRRTALGQRAFERKQPALGDRAAIHAEPFRLAVGGQHAMTGHEDSKGISPDYLADRARRAAGAELPGKFGKCYGFASRNRAGDLVDTAIERRNAAHIEGDIGKIAGLAAQQRRNTLDRDLGIQGGAEFAGVGILAQHPPPGFDLARFRKLHGNNPRSAPCDAASADRRIENGVPAPRHYANHPGGS